MSLCAAQEQVILRSLTPAGGVCEQGCECVRVCVYVHATRVARESRVGALLTFLPRLSAPVFFLALPPPSTPPSPKSSAGLRSVVQRRH